MVQNVATYEYPGSCSLWGRLKKKKENQTRCLCLLKKKMCFTWPFPPSSSFSLSNKQIQLFSNWLSHSNSPTHTHKHTSCASDSAPVQTACQSVCQIGPRNRSQSLTHTRTQWGSQWEIFGMVSLGMSWHVWGMSPWSRLLSLPPFPFPSCPTGRGRSRVLKKTARQHACFWTCWPRLGFSFQ